MNLKAIVISFLLLGAFFFIYGFLLPRYYGSLDSFGFPNTVDDIDTDEELLKYLQGYNEHISQVSRVLSTAFFMLMMIFFSIGGEVYQIFKELDASRNEISQS